MKNSFYKYLSIALLLFLVISTSLYIEKSESYDYLNKVTSDKNDSIVKTANHKYKEILEINKKLQEKYNRPGGNQDIDGVSYNNKKISLEDLIELSNSLLQENSKLQQRIQNDSVLLRNHRDMFNQIEKRNLAKIKSDNGFITEISYELNKSDSLYKIINQIKSDLESKKVALRIIKNNYDIDFSEYTKDGKDYIKLISTERIDSALWVYPYYKHKIKTNRKGETVIK